MRIIMVSIMVIVIFLVITIITESSWSHDHHIAFQAIQLLPQLCPTTGFGPTVVYRHSHNQSHESMVDHREPFTVSFQVQSLFSLLNNPLDKISNHVLDKVFLSHNRRVFFFHFTHRWKQKQAEVTNWTYLPVGNSGVCCFTTGHQLFSCFCLLRLYGLWHSVPSTRWSLEGERFGWGHLGRFWQQAAWKWIHLSIR